MIVTWQIWKSEGGDGPGMNTSLYRKNQMMGDGYTRQESFEGTFAAVTGASHDLMLEFELDDRLFAPIIDNGDEWLDPMWEAAKHVSDAFWAGYVQRKL